MSELYPSDSELAAMSGAADGQQEVLYPTIGESPYYISFYRMLYRLLDAARRAGDLRVYKDGALTFGVRAGTFMNGSTPVAYPGATGQALTNNQSNYIYLTAGGVLTVNTTGFPEPAATPHLPLATIATAAGAYALSDITDCRGGAFIKALSAATAANLNTLVGTGNADSLHKHGAGGLEAAAVTAAKLGYAADALVIVQRGADDAASGANLLAAYTAAKALTPGGNALSATNRACVLIPPGGYVLTPQTGAPAMTLDASFVDLVALASENPAATLVRSAGGDGNGETVLQTADDVHLAGFTIENTGGADGNHAFVVNATDNSASEYRRMDFRQPNAVDCGGELGSYKWYPVRGLSNIDGTWEFCRADAYAWRPAANKNLSATMRDCAAGDSSFGGDASGGEVSGWFERCTAGEWSFGGCGSFGQKCSGTFIDCQAGDRSFAMGKEFSGTARRCVGGDDCFGGYAGGASTHYGTFSGLAEDCIAGGRSFGSGHASALCSGELIRVRNLTMPKAMYLAGARLRDCELKITGSNEHALVLNDSLSKLLDCTLIGNGSGNSIYAAAARNVLAVHCRTNKDKHANVTNLAGDGTLAGGLCLLDADVDV